MVTLRQVAVTLALICLVFVALVSVELTALAEPTARALGWSVLVSVLVGLAIVGVTTYQGANAEGLILPLRRLVLYASENNQRAILVIFTLALAATVLYMLGPGSVQAFEIRCTEIKQIRWPNWRSHIMTQPCEDSTVLEIWRPMAPRAKIQETIRCRPGSKPSIKVGVDPENGELVCAGTFIVSVARKELIPPPPTTATAAQTPPEPSVAVKSRRFVLFRARKQTSICLLTLSFTSTLSST